jgi:hypothetical protein
MPGTGPQIPVIIVIDEIALYCASTGPHADGPDEAAAWLLAEYDATSPGDFEVYDEDHGEYARPHHIQPMVQLKSDMEPCAAMHVTTSDYRDPGRWRL